MKMKESFSVLAICGLLLSGAAGCGDDDEPCTVSEHEDVSGTWQMRMEVTSSCDFEDIGTSYIEEAIVTQQGGQITVEIDGFVLVSELTGSICGDDFSASGSAAEDILGCQGRENVTVSGTVLGDYVSGNVTWSQQVSDPDACMGITSCSGSSTYEGARISP